MDNFFHNIKIVNSKGYAKVFVDGEQLRGVVSIDNAKFNPEGKIDSIQLTIKGNIELIMQGE